MKSLQSYSWKNCFYLLLVESAQHDDGVEEHDDVAAQHFPDIEENRLEADIVETSSCEGVDLKPITTILLIADVDHLLLHGQAVLISNLELKPNPARSDVLGVFRDLQQNLDPDSLGTHHVTRGIPGNTAQIVQVVSLGEKPGAGNVPGYCEVSPP